MLNKSQPAVQAIIMHLSLLPNYQFRQLQIRLRAASHNAGDGRCVKNKHIFIVTHDGCRASNWWVGCTTHWYLWRPGCTFANFRIQSHYQANACCGSQCLQLAPSGSKHQASYNRSGPCSWLLFWFSKCKSVGAIPILLFLKIPRNCLEIRSSKCAIHNSALYMYVP